MSQRGAIEIINASVSIIKIIARGLAPKPSRLGSATGFFFQNNDKKFLVTNRHVVIDDKEESYPDELSIQVHTDRTNAPPCREITLPLYDDNQPVWLEHPENNKDNLIDVAAIELGNLVKESDFVRFWTPNDFIPDTFIPSQGSTVNIIGYPLGFYDTINNLPITRSGSLASPYWTFFNNQPLFLVDANLHPGTSGSPVVLPVTKYLVFEDVQKGAERFPYYLLGVNSGEVPGLGLNAAWYNHLLLDITSS